MVPIVIIKFSQCLNFASTVLGNNFKNGGEMNQDLSRRKFFQAGLGLAGGLAASSSVANVCGIKTGEQGLGPFFPNPGTPEDVINETMDPQVPIFLSNDNDLTHIKGKNGVAQGQQVLISGVLQNENCEPIPNATIIIWQASESGRYNHKGDSQNQDFKDPRDGKIIKRVLDPNFQSWGKAVTSESGSYDFKTIVPGFYPADLSSQNKWYRPPHIHFLVMATGYPQFVTQMYFRGETIKDNDFIQELNDIDYLLQADSLSALQKEDLVVDFEKSPEKNLLAGQFDLTISK